jgi:hypothetical protein
VSAAPKLHRTALTQLREYVRLMRRYGIEPADIIEAVYAEFPDLIEVERAKDRRPPSGFNLHIERDPGQLPQVTLLFGSAYIDSWIEDDPAMAGAEGIDAQARRLDALIAEKLRPLFDGSVVTR